MPKYGYAGLIHGLGEYYQIMESRMDRTMTNEKQDGNCVM